MATATVIGTNASNEFLYGVTGADTKIEGKGGIDYMFGANGNDLLIPGTGNKNLMFGLGETDTFQFTKAVLTWWVTGNWDATSCRSVRPHRHGGQSSSGAC
jgi:Ca2+-binding RTX toxin-like protein